MKENIDPTFSVDDTKDKNVIRKIMQLGHSFTMAIAENNNELAEKTKERGEEVEKSASSQNFSL